MLWLTLPALASPLYLAQDLREDDLDRASEAVLLSAWEDGSLPAPQQERALALLLDIAVEHDDLSGIRQLMEAGAELPDGLDAVHYLRGLDALGSQLPEDAIRHFRQVSPDAPLRVRARYAEGVAFNQQDRLKSAVRAFRDVYQDPAAEPALADRAALNIGRIYYKLERYDTAMVYFRLIRRDSPVWSEALLARAWGHSLLEEPDEALGAVLTLRSPQLSATVFSPEARHLESLLYYERCHYDEVERLTLQTEAELAPMRAELRAVAGLAPEAALVRWLGEADTDSTLPTALFTRLLADRDLQRALDRIDAIAAELAAPGLPDAARAPLMAAHTRARAEAGAGLVAAASHHARLLDEQIIQAEILRFESVEVGWSCTIGQTIGIEQPDALEFICVLPRPTAVWDFHGEFWADELGYYQVELPDVCR